MNFENDNLETAEKVVPTPRVPDARLGLSLAQIFELLGMYDGARNSAPQLRRFLTVLAERRRVIEQQREDIAAVLGEIDTLERLCADLLAGESVAEGAT